MFSTRLLAITVTLAILAGTVVQANMVDDYLGKKYKLHSSDNFDEFMKALGVGFLTRKMANIVSPVVELTKEGKEYSLTSTSTFKNTLLKFELGREFEQETPDGRTVKTVIEAEGPTLRELQTDSDGIQTVIERTWSKEGIKMEMETQGVKATRIYVNE